LKIVAWSDSRKTTNAVLRRRGVAGGAMRPTAVVSARYDSTRDEFRLTLRNGDVRRLVTVVRGTPQATVEPIRRATATDDHYRLYAVSRDNAGALVLSFPLDVVVQGSQVRVAYSHVVRGSSAITNCKDCVVPIGATRLR
jgi:hypothetical protein